MLPGPSSKNVRSGMPIHAYEFFLGKAMHKMQAPNILRILSRKPRSATIGVMLRVISPEVADILFRSNPLKVLNRIVPLVSIFVIYLRKTVWVWNKSLSDQAMDTAPMRSRLVPELDCDVIIADHRNLCDPPTALEGLHRPVFMNPVFPIESRNNRVHHKSTIASMMRNTSNFRCDLTGIRQFTPVAHTAYLHST